jgi:hypothetical protein
MRELTLEHAVCADTRAERLAVKGGHRVEVLRRNADEVHTGDEWGRIDHVV